MLFRSEPPACGSGVVGVAGSVGVVLIGVVFDALSGTDANSCFLLLQDTAKNNIATKAIELILLNIKNCFGKCIKLFNFLSQIKNYFWLFFMADKAT